METITSIKYGCGLFRLETENLHVDMPKANNMFGKGNPVTGLSCFVRFILIILALCFMYSYLGLSRCRLDLFV